MQEVVCAVCGRRTALAPGSAMACPSCGAPISAPALAAVEDDSATRPSILPLPTVDETTKVVTPVSAVQEPAAANADASASAPDVTADYPMPPTPERTQTLPAPAMPPTESQTQPVTPVESPTDWPNAPVAPGNEALITPQAAERKRNPFALISAIFLVLLLLAAIAAGIYLANGRLPFFGATPTATIAATMTPAPTATTAASLKTFTDGGNVYTIGYPNGWLLSTQNDAASQLRYAIFANPTTGENFTIGTYAGTDVPAQQVAENTLATLAQKTGIANRSGPTSVFIAGQLWMQESGDVTIKVKETPTQEHAVALATLHGGHTIYVLELAPLNTFPTAEPTFMQMLQTLEFQS